MLKINDKAGRRSAAEIRGYFESAVRSTDVLTKALPLEAVQVDGRFSHYANAATDYAWVGFALGMRGADQLAERRELLARQVPEWMPINSAPKDGQAVLLLTPTTFGKWAKSLPMAGRWFGTYWAILNADEAIQRVEPTHWMPLPAAPKAGDAKEDRGSHA